MIHRDEWIGLLICVLGMGCILAVGFYVTYAVTSESSLERIGRETIERRLTPITCSPCIKTNYGG